MKFTVKQASEHYGVTTITIRNWLKDGNIKTEIEKVIGIKPRIIVDSDNIDKYLKSKTK